MNKPKSNRKKYIVKPKVGKKLIISTVASVMAVTIALSLVWHAMKVSVPVEANTLSGIDAALKDHGSSGEAFVILDIVPGSVSEGVPLGTIGDLTSGQSQFELYLADTFKNNPDTYSSYEARREEANTLANSYASDGYKYLESPFKENSSWSDVYVGEPFDPNDSFDEDEALEGYWSIVKGHVKPAENGEYKLVSEMTKQTMIVAIDETSYKKSNEPLYEGYSLYSSEVLNDENISRFDDDTPVYEIDDEGNYNYISTIAEYIANKDERAENLAGYKERIEKNKEKIESYNEEIANLQQKYDELNQLLEELEQQTSQEETTSPATEAEGDSTGDGSAGDDSPENDTVVSLNWVKFLGTDDSLFYDAETEGSTSEIVTDDGTGDDSEEVVGTEPDSGESDGDGESDVEGDGEDEGDGESDVEGDGDGNGESDVEGDGEDEGDGEGDGESDGEDEGDGDGESDVEGDGEDEGDGEGDGESDGEGDGDESGDSNEPVTDDQSEELKQKQEELDQLNKELEELNAKLGELHEEQEALQSELDALEEEPEEEYYVAEFEHEIVKKGGEPISGLYVPTKSEEVPLEKPAMFALGDDGEEEDPLSGYEVDEGNKLVYVGPENGGTHTIIRDSSNAGENILLFGAPVYIRCYHEDLLKEYVFCDSGLNIKINVVSAAKVSEDDVKDANLIYLEDVEGRDNVQYINSDFDMSPSVVFKIIDRAVNDYTPVIVNRNVSTGGSNGIYNESNYQKLGSILMMSDFSSFFMDMEENIDNMLMGKNAESDEYGRKTEANYVNNNIYVVDSSGTLSARGRFNEEFTDEEMGGFEEVKSAIDMENKQGKELPGPSRAMAIQYIINYANGFIGEFRDFSILELQPTQPISDLTDDLGTRFDSRNNTVLYWKKFGSSSSGQQIVRSSNPIKITVNTESVAQFVGEQSDINDKYQMIFIGLDGQNLNNEDKNTVYNDQSLNGRVYSSVGDTADGEGQRYEGIDITRQKKNALLEFMKAGYPIVVENDFFVDKSAKDANAEINTDYIDPSSEMYDFLRSALSSDDYRWCLYTIADIHANYPIFTAQINVHRPRIEFDTDNDNVNSAYAQPVQWVSADAVDGKYRGYIAYKITNDIGEYYDQSWDWRFYLDMNQDGRFDDSEDRTNDVFNSNGVLMVEFPNPERGSIPWKLEVFDEGNRYRRDDLTGYFNINIDQSKPLPIRIVQVIGADDPDNPNAAYNLQAAYELMSDQALLGYYLKYAADRLTNTEFDISTMTVGQLAAELKSNEKYLSGVDVLVLGFGPDYSLSVPVEGKGLNVDAYVNEYIEAGRGVLVSSAASSAATGMMQLNAGALGLREDTKTYNSLGNTKPSDFKYKYSNLESNMFNKWGYLSASRINDGAISHYPYEVGERVKLGGNEGSELEIADYVLDLKSNSPSGTATDVTAWYTLGNSYKGAETSYGASVNDAANNYYIYSKGNVVYVGARTYPYVYDGTGGAEPADDIEGTVDCRLFVNALMEAYTVGIKNPRVTIVAGLSEGAAETDSICIPYDEQIREMEESEGVLNSKGVLDDTVDVYFKISEPNFAFGKDVEIHFYYEDNIAGELKNIGGDEVKVTEFFYEMWTVYQNQLVPVDVSSVLDYGPEKIYKIKAPVVSLKDNDNSVKADIYIVVQSYFDKLGQPRDPIGSDSVTLNRAQLFLLE